MTTDPRCEAADLSSVLLMCAGAPVPESLLHQYLERGAKATQGYGLTESTAVVSLIESDFATAKLGPAGMPDTPTAVQPRDPEGAVITADAGDGGLWSRGPNVLRGVRNQPDATAALSQDK